MRAIASDTSLVFNLLAKDKVTPELTKLSGSFERLGARIKTFAMLAAGGFAGVAIVGQIKGIISAASDLNEAQNKIQVLFGKDTAQIQKWAAAAATSMGQSTLAATDAAATMGVFGKAAGLTGGQLVSFSTKMAGLSSDLASFYNTSPEEAMQAIGAALRGESEPIRRYGVLLDDAQLRQQAFAMGLTNTTKHALLPQQRVLAAQALILKQTGAAQGDFARTSGGLANQQRILSAEVTNFKARLGGALLPIAIKVATFFTGKVLPAFSALADAFSSGTVTSGGFIGAVQEVGATLGNTFAIFKGQPIADEAENPFTRMAHFIKDQLFPAVSRIIQTLGTLITAGGRFVRWIFEGSNGAKVFTATIVAFTAAWVAYKTVATAVKVATQLWTVAQAILNAVMSANPIGLVIIAVAGLTAGFIYLWKTSAGFRNFFKDLWKNIKTWAIDAKNGIVGAWNSFIGFFAKLPGRIGSIAVGMWDGIKNAFRSAVNWIIGKWNNLSLTIGGQSVPLPFGLGFDIPSITLGTPDIPFLAKGGVVTRPTLAMVGDRGPEAVVPLDRGPLEVRVVLDVTGGDEDLKRMIRKMVHVNGRGNVQVAFGR